ncbi:MAG: hypothetical protein LBG27_10610 [Spirochaetaceae bacterium]|nr:hypothetical protein [Spirochaetaceae bacterium]
MLPILNERQRRIFLAKQAAIPGYGGITEASGYTGISRQTIANGIKELNEDADNFTGANRSRRPGGGGKNIREHYPEIVQTITGLIEGRTKGSPEKSLLRTSKSIRKIKVAPEARGIKASHTRTGRILKEAGYSLQAGRKEPAKNSCHADRDTQFEYINRRTKRAVKGGKAVLSTDAKWQRHAQCFTGGIGYPAEGVA